MKAQQRKDNENFNSLLQNTKRRKILSLLLQGRRLTTVEATKELNVPDFRSHIRFIRKAGVPVSDVWVYQGKHSRFKVYFIRKEARK